MLPNLSHVWGQSAAIALGLFIIVLSIGGVVLMATIYWKIFSKAGYSGALGLLMFVPIGNFVALCILAFGKWPIYQEFNQLHQRVGTAEGQ